MLMLNFHSDQIILADDEGDLTFKPGRDDPGVLLPGHSEQHAVGGLRWVRRRRRCPGQEGIRRPSPVHTLHLDLIREKGDR